MKNKVRNIQSNSGRFQDGNPATGELGTVVTAQWLNEMQDFAQDAFEELKNVLALGNVQPIANQRNQLAQVLQGYFVKKSGDTMTGNLEIDRADSYIRGKQGSNNKWWFGKPSAYSDDVGLFNYPYNYGITLKSDRVESQKPFYVGRDVVYHAGNTPTATDAQLGFTQLSHETNGRDKTKAASEFALGEVRRLANQAQVTADGIALTWNNVQNKPNTFPPSSHTHGWGQITGVPSATTEQKGITQLDSSTNSNAENKAATPKAIKIVKDLIDALTRNLTNYIPNSKKSNSVSSTSSDTVATSNAVKQAYDLARSKQSPATTLSGYGITDAVKLQDMRVHAVHNTPFDDATPAQLPLGTFVGLSAKATLSNQRADGWQMISKGWSDASGKYACVRLGIANNRFYYQTAASWNQWAAPIELATADDYVKKSGDTMTGNLVIDDAGSIVQGKRQGQAHWFVGLPNGMGTDILLHAYKHNTELRLKSDRAEFNKPLYVNDNQVHHEGKSYVDITISNGDYGGANFRRRGSAGNWDSRIEPLVDKRWKFWVQNSHEIFLPAKGGTVLLDNDFTYQKSGGFEIRKYPDGTMIQTFVYEQNDIYPERGEQTFAWAVAFTGRPLMVGQITTSYDADHDCGVNILSKSTNARVYYRFYEHGHPNQGLCRVQFLAIGRWK